MKDQELVTKTADFVKQKFASESTGHDWWHLYRVWQLSKRIAKEEKGANMLVVELAALLHDIADWKFHDGDEEAGPKAAEQWLKRLDIDQETTAEVVYIVRHISFKSGINQHTMKTIEGKIVQDADRLDAVGAIGIARVFATGAVLGRTIYDPAIKLKKYNSLQERFENLNKDTTINHLALIP